MRPIAKLKNQLLEQTEQTEQTRLADYLPTTFKGEGILARTARKKMQTDEDRLERFRELQHKGLSQKEKAEEFWEYRTSDQN